MGATVRREKEMGEFEGPAVASVAAVEPKQKEQGDVTR